MRLSDKKIKELMVWEYFIPKNCSWKERTDKDIQMFFEWSEQGKHKDIVTIPTYKPEGQTYFHALYWGKKRAGINIHELWNSGKSDIPLHEIITDLPRHVAEFVKKELQLEDKEVEIDFVKWTLQNI